VHRDENIALADYALGIDIGGTFTDAVLLDQRSGDYEVAKTLTTYPDPAAGVLSGLDSLLDRAQIGPESVERVIHGTTLVTNTLIERKGTRTGLITTRGFRDALEIGREGRYDIYDLRLELPEPLVERRLRLEVDERLNPDGTVMSPLSRLSVEAACEALSAAEVDAVAICLLHAYANPDHERAVRDEVGHRLPGCAISISSEVSPELREFERTSTTVANAYVQPLVRRYLATLQEGLLNIGIRAPLHVMLSNGGSCSVDTASLYPVRLVESGPCGGALAAAECGRRAKLDRILAFDMGGTTAKAILSVKGDFPVTTESEVARVYRFKRGSGLPLLVPVLDMIEIGAGGGSIAHRNALGLPAVGPESAGSTPGPACYDRHGSEPTVTDADLVLGYLNPDYFLGGDMRLNLERAREAILTVADAFGGDVVRASLGIHQLVNEHMANAARVHAAERGVDLRSFSLVATGGAGPVHACGVAARLGLERVLVPPIAGVGSAYGLLLAPISFDYARSYVTRTEDLVTDRLRPILEDMAHRGAAVVQEAGVDEQDRCSVVTADMRYVGQGHEIRVPLPDVTLDDGFSDRLKDAFEAEYANRFGRKCEGVSVEVIHWRTTVSGPTQRYDIAAKMDETANPKKDNRDVVFDVSGPVDTVVYDRYRLSGCSISGPAIIEEEESTTVLPPGWDAEMLADGSILMTRQSS
jgi:N-methylhydantoinase A